MLGSDVTNVYQRDYVKKHLQAPLVCVYCVQAKDCEGSDMPRSHRLLEKEPAGQKERLGWSLQVALHCQTGCDIPERGHTWGCPLTGLLRNAIVVGGFLGTLSVTLCPAQARAPGKQYIFAACSH